MIQPPLANQVSAAASQQLVVPPPRVATQVAIPQPSSVCPPSPEVSTPEVKTMYYIQIDGAKQGPFEAKRIVQMIASRQVTEQWQPIRNIQLM